MRKSLRFFDRRVFFLHITLHILRTLIGLLIIFAWLILKPFKFFACVVIILIVRTSFMSFKLTGNKIDRGLPEPIGVTRINCRMFRFPLHVRLRIFTVFSCGVSWTCCLGAESVQYKTPYISYLFVHYRMNLHVEIREKNNNPLLKLIIIKKLSFLKLIFDYKVLRNPKSMAGIWSNR